MLELTNLKLMPLPFVIHGIQILLHIEKRGLAEVIRVYEIQEQLGGSRCF